jgi:hypothetical protein
MEAMGEQVRRVVEGARRDMVTPPPTEPPSDSVFTELLQASLNANPGCCGDFLWRGHLCQYHEGFVDGMHALAARDGSDAT